MSIENGSDWVYPLLKGLKKLANTQPWVFDEAPLETLRRHVWVAPYYEEDLRRLADTIGVERILFGSDWPHGEGLADPAGYTAELADDHGFDQREIDLVMRGNSAELLGLPVHATA